MGIPKFFRWISERYPTISPVIADNRIPEFDCLYLDMNGIIHNCTHKDSELPMAALSDEQIFVGIFDYIGHLFATIKPRKLFFMAIDGVAPRAKMNQQRSRRFRTALSAEKAQLKAKAESLPCPQKIFDSNCITPGTEFMAKLSYQLHYFISKKVSEDTDWRDIEIVLSGHEVPGEGEHKIMKYIRQLKAQPDYDINRRHCLYGLDADLIMLGLLSHDPHFCLLREEVTFGRQQNSNKNKSLEHQNFYLLHLCLVREYLELEFSSLKKPGILSFPFELEKIIDDFVLMAFFVGNDFLPNLPHLHINENALSLMFEVYQDTLPLMDGYINEAGKINLHRLSILLERLTRLEKSFFESEEADYAWIQSKLKMQDQEEQANSGANLTTAGAKNQRLIMTPDQKKLFKQVKQYIQQAQASNHAIPSLDLSDSLPARDRKFVQTLAEKLNLEVLIVTGGFGNSRLRLMYRSRTDGELDDPDDSGHSADAAVFRILRQYDRAIIKDLPSRDQVREAEEQKYQEGYRAWKNKYYVSKFGWGLDNETEIRKLTENYVQGLQWVLHYYYNGIISWPWFYRYHYAPMISDVSKGLGANMEFEVGKPFRPFEQLLAVLPDRSKQIVPAAFHFLMTDPESPIIDFYPREFELDLNGKKMDWEAVVKIPFIQEDRLLAAMEPKMRLLTDEERARNQFGEPLKFVYDGRVDHEYLSSVPGVFPNISNCHCVQEVFHMPSMDGLDVIVGLMKGVKLGTQALAGFPSLKWIPFDAKLSVHGVTVFQQQSRQASMVLNLTGQEARGSLSKSLDRLGKSVYVGYPHLQEARVVKVSDPETEYVLLNGQVVSRIKSDRDRDVHHKTCVRIEEKLSKRNGIMCGPVKVVLQVELLHGLRKTADGARVKEYEHSDHFDSEYAAQTIVDEVANTDSRFDESGAVPIQEEFPPRSRAFFLGKTGYGSSLEVVSHSRNTLNITVFINKVPEREFGRQIAKKASLATVYLPSHSVARILNMAPLVLSKLTSALMVQSGSRKVNLGLSLKFEARKLKVLGYTRRTDSGWEYSGDAVKLIQQYMLKFPIFIAGLMMNVGAESYEDRIFFPEEEASIRVNEIRDWLKSLKIDALERVSLCTEQFSEEVVREIEAAVAEQGLQKESQVDGKRLTGIPRMALLKTSGLDHRLGGQNFSLGDRIIYVLDSGKVPSGSRGTVVGRVNNGSISYLDIVFDRPVISGATLGDNKSPSRGITVPASAVLNLSDKQLIVHTGGHSMMREDRRFEGRRWKMGESGGDRRLDHAFNGSVPVGERIDGEAGHFPMNGPIGMSAMGGSVWPLGRGGFFAPPSGSGGIRGQFGKTRANTVAIPPIMMGGGGRGGKSVVASRGERDQHYMLARGPGGGQAAQRNGGAGRGRGGGGNRDRGGSGSRDGSGSGGGSGSGDGSEGAADGGRIFFQEKQREDSLHYITNPELGYSGWSESGVGARPWHLYATPQFSSPSWPMGARRPSPGPGERGGYGRGTAPNAASSFGSAQATSWWQPGCSGARGADFASRRAGHYTMRGNQNSGAIGSMGSRAGPHRINQAGPGRHASREAGQGGGGTSKPGPVPGY